MFLDSFLRHECKCLRAYYKRVLIALPNDISGRRERRGQFWGTSLWGFIALVLGLVVTARGGSSGVASLDQPRVTRPA
jgi:hypothetical protein